MRTFLTSLLVLVGVAVGWLVLGPQLLPRRTSAIAAPAPRETVESARPVRRASPAARTQPRVVAPAVARRPVVPPGPRRIGAVIDDPCVRVEGDRCLGYALDPFFTALRRVAEGDGLARVSQFGDSVTASDVITGRLRRRLQERFGDGGAGFVYLGQPSKWEQPFPTAKVSSSKLGARSIVGPYASDGLYGLGGASYDGPGSVRIAPKRGRAGTVEVYYLTQPSGGTLDVTIDGKRTRVDTRGERTTSSFLRVEPKHGAKSVSLRASAAVRAFGVVLENQGPGVVVDTLGLVCGTAMALGRIDDEHFAEQLARRASDLVVVMVGANDVEFLPFKKDPLVWYREQFDAMLAQLREARPQASCLVLAPLDAAVWENGQLVTRPGLADMVAVQRQAAARAGCAFFDTFAWMGGAGSAVSWRADGLLGKDYVHVTPKGGEKLADALVDALLTAL